MDYDLKNSDLSASAINQIKHLIHINVTILYVTWTLSYYYPYNHRKLRQCQENKATDNKILAYSTIMFAFKDLPSSSM